MKAIWMSDRGQALLDTIYTGALREKLEAQVQFVSTITSAQEAQASKEQLKDVECIFSTWGMLPLSAEQIRECFPSLKAVFYGAGSVQYFARPFLQSGVRVFSSAAANAVPVAEYTLAQILLAGKGFYQASRLYKEGQHKKVEGVLRLKEEPGLEWCSGHKIERKDCHHCPEEGFPCYVYSWVSAVHHL